MTKLTDLQPERVFFYFEEICKIPHGSGNTQAVSDWLEKCSHDFGLECIRDDMGNIVIFKPATEGYENEPVVIIQGHMDMVAVSDSGVDMKTSGLDLFIDGEYIGAKGTSLGGDDGIAVAYALAILESDDIEHPALEVVLTVDEEVGMLGAAAMDMSMIKGRRLLNLDNEMEGQILTGCAGGGRVNIQIPVFREPEINGTPGKQEYDTESIFEIAIKNCRGGHSGEAIDKGRINPLCAAGRILYELIDSDDSIKGKVQLELISIDGGVADNAIPTEAHLVVAVKGNKQDVLNVSKVTFSQIANNIVSEYETTEPDMVITMNQRLWKNDKKIYSSIPENLSKKIARIFIALPNGIQAMSMDVPGLVETSLNLGIVETTDDCIKLSFAVRSSIETAKMALIDRLRAISDMNDCLFSMEGLYPGWKFKKNSPFRDKLVHIYKESFGKEPCIEAIHAGLECGFFEEKLQGLDSVSIGPDMNDIHTARERLSVSSVQRTWEFILKILETRD